MCPKPCDRIGMAYEHRREVPAWGVPELEAIGTRVPYPCTIASHVPRDGCLTSTSFSPRVTSRELAPSFVGSSLEAGALTDAALSGLRSRPSFVFNGSRRGARRVHQAP